jgi:Xaa-Pro aminopeptidase
MQMPTSDLITRLNRAQNEMSSFGIDGLCLSPGPDLRYFIDYEAKDLERITCLIISSNKDPILLVPRLEKLPAQASGAGRIGLEIRTYGEFDDPYSIIANFLQGANSIAVDDRMWAIKAKGIENAMPDVNFGTAGKFTSKLRSVKSQYEIEALKRVSQSIDNVHVQVPNLIKAGRTELEIARDIGALILENGHAKVDFIIVAAGANSASPHHEPTNKVIEAGEVVVVDIGGTSHEGYCSDCTRTYALDGIQDQFVSQYNVLLEAQKLAVEAVRAGIKPSVIDAACRDHLTHNGLGEYFIHRTGHGIGVETHEEPYIGSALHEPILQNQVFSVEPGFYIEQLHGARIEDIVVATNDSVISLNNVSRELRII